MHIRTKGLRCRITLECGCTIATRNTAQDRRSKYACSTNQGHGYSLGWTSTTDLDARNPIVRHNPVYQEQ
jgi:hypothetical protein